jgi:hypothetical protein
LFYPDIDLPLQANRTVDVFEIIKSTVRTFDPKTIALGSTRSYKTSSHLRVDSKCNVYVPRESTYEAEMYRILHNWLVKVHGLEVTSQWHLEKIGDDGDNHHFYCDLAIKSSNNPFPVAVLELLATGTIPVLKKHFDQVLTYADQLRSREMWIVHFSREDSIISKPYWPDEERLNVIHFWHNLEFTSVKMSAKFQDSTGKVYKFINKTIIP